MRKANLILTTLFSIVSCSLHAQTELLQNTNFETPGAYWTASGNFHYNNQYCCNYNSPTSFAYLSDASGNAMNNALGDLGQSSIYVPANTTALTLTFYSFIGTLETTTTQAFDILHITIGNASYNEYVDFSNLDLSSGYVLKTVTISGFANYLGQYISLNFHGTTDGGLPTKFRIDDVSLKATVPNCSAVSVNSQPSNQIASTGTTAQFCVTANGTPPFTYQWYNQNGQIIGANSSCYTTPILNISDNGNQYYCIISNCSNTYQDQSNYASLTVNSSCLNVSINNTLSNQSATVGGNVTWTVNTTGTAPLNHQWYKNGIQISGANSNAYTTPNLTIGDNGNTYYCNVINCSGSGNATSNTATLNITTNCAGASITNTLPNQNSVVGGSVTWTVNAAGTAPFTYQWYKNGIQISGAVSNIYTSPALNIGNNGNTYYCVVTNCSGAGNVISNTATLTVNSSSTPTITVTSPNGGEVWNIGSPYNITANISGNITSKLLEISYDGGVNWACNGYVSNSSNSLNYSWTPTVTTSTSCRIRVTVSYAGGIVSDISNANFTINSATGGGQPFELSSTLSHLFWPFYNSAYPGALNPTNTSWATHPVNGWISGTEDGLGGGSGHGDGGHKGADYFADDWNWNSGIADCNMDFYAPLDGTVIFIKPFCNQTCVSSFNSCYGNNPPAPYSKSYGNQVIIRSSSNPNYAFRVTHLNDVTVAKNDHVSVGDKLGTIGGTGASDFAHAHCVLYKRINETDPPLITTNGLTRLNVGTNLNNDASNTNSKYKAEFVFDAVTMSGSGGAGSDSSWATITASGNTTLCNGDSVLLTASPGISYYWSSGQTTQSIYASATAVYYVIITDSIGDTHISIPTYINVITPPETNISSINSKTSFCQGDSLVLFASPEFLAPEGGIEGTDISFLWSNGTTNYSTTVSSPGIYSVTVTNSCASVIDSLGVTMDSLPIQPTIQMGGTILASSTFNLGTYQWNLNGVPIPGATSQFDTVSVSGFYTVTIINNVTGCSSSSNPTYVVVTGIENSVTQNKIRVSPNPTMNTFNLEFEIEHPHNEILISLYNAIGQIVLNDKIENAQYGKINKSLDVEFLINGVYQLQIKLDDGMTFNKKVIIQK